MKSPMKPDRTHGIGSWDDKGRFNVLDGPQNRPKDILEREWAADFVQKINQLAGAEDFTLEPTREKGRADVFVRGADGRLVEVQLVEAVNSDRLAADTWLKMMSPRFIASISGVREQLLGMEAVITVVSPASTLNNMEETVRVEFLEKVRSVLTLEAKKPPRFSAFGLGARGVVPYAANSEPPSYTDVLISGVVKVSVTHQRYALARAGYPFRFKLTKHPDEELEFAFARAIEKKLKMRYSPHGEFWLLAYGAESYCSLDEEHAIHEMIRSTGDIAFKKIYVMSNRGWPAQVHPQVDNRRLLKEKPGGVTFYPDESLTLLQAGGWDIL